MALNTTQQIFETIQKSNHPLIAFRKNWSGDAVATSLALRSILRKLGKPTVDVASDGFITPKKLTFLPEVDTIKPTINNLRKLIISLDVAENRIGDLHYEMQGNKLNIFVAPEEKNLDAKNISTALSDYRYDLTLVLDTPDLESLGDVYQQNADFFYRTPVVNIDHDPSNEQFGQINLVEMNATSTAEILFNFLESLDPQLIDEEIATYLLTGMISKTKSFKSPSVTPRTLGIASQLIARGARREEIIKNLYQTKTIGTLKLWGRALMRLKSDPSTKIVWTLITRDDFITSGAEEEELPEVIDELIANSPDANIVVLFYEIPYLNSPETKICCMIKTLRGTTADRLISRSAEGGKDFKQFCLSGARLTDAEKLVIEEIKMNLLLKK
ncbi:MAG: DHH family phosphoesterase [Patescibacteria group bacterium]